MSNWTGMRGVQAAVGGPSQRTPSRRASRAAAVCPDSGLTAKRSRAARIMVLEHARWVPWRVGQTIAVCGLSAATKDKNVDRRQMAIACPTFAALSCLTGDVTGGSDTVHDVRFCC